MVAGYFDTLQLGSAQTPAGGSEGAIAHYYSWMAHNMSFYIEKNDATAAHRKWVVFVFNKTTGNAVTGDAANITANIRKDSSTAATNDVNPTELEDGYYEFDLTQAETNFDQLMLFPATTTGSTQVIALPPVLRTYPVNFEAIGIESDGDVHADVKQHLGVAVPAFVGGRYDVDVGDITGTSVIALAQFDGAAIDSTVLATNAIGASQIAADAIGASELATDAIGDAQIATGAIASTAFAPGAINAASIATDAITAAKIAANAIGASELATDAIGDAQIAANAIAASAFAADAISAAAFSQAAADKVITQVSGTADSGSTTTLVDDALTEADTDYWVGSLLLMTSGNIAGQVRRIVGFNFTTNTITVDTAFTQAVLGQDYAVLRTQYAEAPAAGSFWNATEQANIRDALGVDGTQTAGSTPGDVQLIKTTTDKITFGTANRVDAQVFGIENDAITAATTAADYLTEIRVEAAGALTDIQLDHLLHVADAGTTTNDSIIAKMVASDTPATFASFSNTTDSQEAVRDRGDSAWITAAGTSTLTAAQVNTEVDNALSDIQLDHLLHVADASTTTTNSILAKMAASDGVFSGFANSTDSLEALRDRVDNRLPDIASLANINTQVDTALSDIQLDHLLHVADASTTTNDSIIAKMVASDTPATFASYSNATDSSEAVRDRGDAAWITATGFSTHSAADVWTSGTRTVTAIGTGVIDATARNEIADSLLSRNVSNVEATAGEHTFCTIVLATLEWDASVPNVLTIKRTDGSTTHVTKTTVSAAGNPITSVS